MAGTVLHAGGNQTLIATFMPTDTTNYVSTSITTTINVTPAPLTIVADDAQKDYGAAIPPLTAHYLGFVNGDTPAHLDTAPTLSTTATAASAPGVYPINAAGAVDSDYTISDVPGRLTIFERPKSIPGDYNGDGLTDLALYYRQPNSLQGIWYVSNVTPGDGLPFGSSTEDIPVQGDFDGDGKADIALYRPSTAQWFIAGRPAVSFGQPNVDTYIPHTSVTLCSPETYTEVVFELRRAN